MIFNTSRTGRTMSINFEFDAADGSKISEAVTVSGSPEVLRAFEAALQGKFPHTAEWVPIEDVPELELPKPAPATPNALPKVEPKSLPASALNNSGPQEPLATQDWFDGVEATPVAVANAANVADGGQPAMQEYDWFDAATATPVAVANATAAEQEPIAATDW